MRSAKTARTQQAQDAAADGARGVPFCRTLPHRHKASSVAALGRGTSRATTRRRGRSPRSSRATRALRNSWSPGSSSRCRGATALVPESSQLAHLAGLFDPARGFHQANVAAASLIRRADFRRRLDEVRAASLDDGTVTYLTSGNAPGTLARQVRTLAGQGELTGLKVFASRDETLCLNVFNFDTAAPDSCFEAEEALAPHLEYARAKGGEGF